MTTTTWSPAGVELGHLGAELGHGLFDDVALFVGDGRRADLDDDGSHTGAPVKLAHHFGPIRLPVELEVPDADPVPLPGAGPGERPVHPEAAQATLGVGERAGVGEVRQGHRALGLAAPSRPATPSGPRSTTTPAGHGPVHAPPGVAGAGAARASSTSGRDWPSSQGIALAGNG